MGDMAKVNPYLKAVLIALSPFGIGALGVVLAIIAGCDGNEGSGTMTCHWLPPPFGQIILTMCMVGAFGLGISLPVGACYLLVAIFRSLWRR